MHRSLIRALVASLVVVSLAACGGGGGDSKAETKAKLGAQLEAEGLDKESAACFAGVVVDEIGADKARKVDFSAEAPPAELKEELAAAAIKAVTSCKIDINNLNK